MWGRLVCTCLLQIHQMELNDQKIFKIIYKREDKIKMIYNFEITKPVKVFIEFTWNKERNPKMYKESHEKAILSKNKAVSISIPDFKMYDKAKQTQKQINKSCMFSLISKSWTIRTHAPGEGKSTH